MFQVRIHGRGGQGVVTAAEMLSIAAFCEGKYAQAFPSFGSERMGAPVVSFCRISDKEIRLREPVDTPDAIIVQDRSVIAPVNAFQGVIENGIILVNSNDEESFKAEMYKKYDFLNAKKICMKCVGATELALKHIGRPLPNAVLLGSFAASTGVIKIDSVIEAIKTKFSGSVADKNIEASVAAYEEVLAAA